MKLQHRQTDNFFDIIYGGMQIFFQLNLLHPYSLCSQGDNLILESDTFVCSGDESKSCHITSIFALA